MILTYNNESYNFLTRDLNHSVDDNVINPGGSSYTYKTTFTGTPIANTLVGVKTQIHKLVGYIMCTTDYLMLLNWFRSNIGNTLTIEDDDLTIEGVLINPNMALTTIRKEYYKLDLEVLVCLN